MKCSLILILSILSMMSQPMTNGLAFKKIKEPLKCFSCDTLGLVNYSQHEFRKTVNFAGSKFHGPAKFSTNIYYSTADFANAEFIDTAIFDNSQFMGLAYFQGTEFNSVVHFYGSHFYDEANFEGAIFSGSQSRFWGCDFYKEAVFRYAIFESPADFHMSNFDSTASFSGTIFNMEADFSECVFKNDISFENTEFKNRLNLSNIRDISKRIDLTNVANTGIVPINLYNTDISKIKIDYKRFKLYLPDTVSFEYRQNVYQALLKNFENDGFTESYELLDKEYQALVYDHNDEYIKRFVAKWWWGYGYNKERIFIWSGVILLMLSIITIFLLEHLMKNVYELENIPASFEPSTKGRFRRVYYSFVYTSVIFFSINMKREKLKYGKWYLLAYLFTIYIIGIVCLAYMANFILKN